MRRADERAARLMMAGARALSRLLERAGAKVRRRESMFFCLALEVGAASGVRQR
jgi:hypothetical protein